MLGIHANKIIRIVRSTAPLIPALLRKWTQRPRPSRGKFLRHARIKRRSGRKWRRRKSVGASEAETGEWADGFVGYNAAMAEDFLALRSRVVALMRRQIGFAAHVERFD